MKTTTSIFATYSFIWLSNYFLATPDTDVLATSLNPSLSNLSQNIVSLVRTSTLKSSLFLSDFIRSPLLVFTFPGPDIVFFYDYWGPYRYSLIILKSSLSVTKVFRLLDSTSSLLSWRSRCASSFTNLCFILSEYVVFLFLDWECQRGERGRGGFTSLKELVTTQGIWPFIPYRCGSSIWSFRLFLFFLPRYVRSILDL